MAEVPADILALARRRDAARAARDFAAADALRDEITGRGYRVVDGPDGTSVEESARTAPRAVRAADVPSVLDRPPTADASLQWVVEGWPEDVARAIASFRVHAGGHRLAFVVVDLVGLPDDAFDRDVEVIALSGDPGWATARNAGMRRSIGAVTVVIDGSVEATGDAIGPLLRALADPAVGVVGPYGIVSDDLREFRRSPGPEVDAIEGYLMAFRREVGASAGGFDERFRYYRSADIEFSFRIRDAGRSARVVDVPVVAHDHRMWTSTPEDERERLSRRNFNRFLDRWRGRTDLLVGGAATREPD